MSEEPPDLVETSEPKLSTQLETVVLVQPEGTVPSMSSMGRR